MNLASSLTPEQRTTLDNFRLGGSQPNDSANLFRARRPLPDGIRAWIMSCKGAAEAKDVEALTGIHRNTVSRMWRANGAATVEQEREAKKAAATLPARELPPVLRLPGLVGDINAMAAAALGAPQNTCRFPVDDDSSFRFCGERVANLRVSYCLCHSQLTFSKAGLRVLGLEARP